MGQYVLSVARLEKNKRVDLAVRAVAHVPSHLRLVVVGEGSVRRAIEEAAEETGAADRITFAGAVSDTDLVALYRTHSASYTRRSTRTTGWRR